MKRIGVFVVLTVLAATGCGSDTPAASPPPTTKAPTATASATTSAAPTVSGSPSTLIEFTVDGAGPYQLGATLASLQAGGKIDEMATGAPCPDNTTARGTGTWKDVRLSFHKDGRLYYLVNRSSEIPTPSGAWLGTPLAQLKTIYAGVTGADLTQGANSAYLVTTLSGRGILFELDPAKKVSAMHAGDAAFLRTNFQGGSNYC